MSPITDILTVALGGALGATCRFLAQAVMPLSSRWGLIAVNLTGCLLIGIVWRLQPSRALSLLLVTGVLGGFTTFSSFGFDTLTLLREGRLAEALGYVAVSVLGGLALTAVGWYATGVLTQKI
ncbi:MAG: fluoride efflux transporter CrcB [Muribaculaceae bacterium]|nr:fluoride efflux transporter CrcB [Muribaculaceae bacterium]